VYLPRCAVPSEAEYEEQNHHGNGGPRHRDLKLGCARTALAVHQMSEGLDWPSSPRSDRCPRMPRRIHRANCLRRHRCRRGRRRPLFVVKSNLLVELRSCSRPEARRGAGCDDEIGDYRITEGGSDIAGASFPAAGCWKLGLATRPRLFLVNALLCAARGRGFHRQRARDERLAEPRPLTKRPQSPRTSVLHPITTAESMKDLDPHKKCRLAEIVH
jgi:hypothetical protein